MAQVRLHVYDVTNLESENMNSAITTVNGVTRQLGLGGAFHGAVEIYGWEWSFGFCERGTGVYRCLPKSNTMYSYRETVELGNTNLTPQEVQILLRRLGVTWPGNSYDLLTRNCCHFCQDFVGQLGLEHKFPHWVNRMAYGANVTLQYTSAAVAQMKSIQEGLVLWWQGDEKAVAAQQRNGQSQNGKVGFVERVAQRNRVI
eukprot:TRINITY_DN12225_c0_g1_i2.p2 TRINITY_DN12225_c0_g1~~TRINITY_DN12225_c0_g1_i2.p2  ORF type:complete len:234 (-),score=14.94 TRINITY_DN12225_c0_g1_i2:220-822(-)